MEQACDVWDVDSMNRFMLQQEEMDKKIKANKAAVMLREKRLDLEVQLEKEVCQSQLMTERRQRERIMRSCR